jgi:hypothetical protein
MKKSEWYTVVDDERGTLKLEFFRGMAFLHLDFRLPLAGMRAAKELFPDVKRILARLDYRRMYVIIPEGNDKLYKFEQHFGFSEEKRAGGQILMGQEI